MRDVVMSRFIDATRVIKRRVGYTRIPLRVFSKGRTMAGIGDQSVPQPLGGDQLSPLSMWSAGPTTRRFISGVDAVGR
jgi:hypothetical protein